MKAENKENMLLLLQKKTDYFRSPSNKTENHKDYTVRSSFWSPCKHAFKEY